MFTEPILSHEQCIQRPVLGRSVESTRSVRGRRRDWRVPRWLLGAVLASLAGDKLIEALQTRYELQASEPPDGWKDIDPYDRLDAQLWLYERSTGQRISLRKWALENDAVRPPDKRPAK